jgi:hypothetical protein
LRVCDSAHRHWVGLIRQRSFNAFVGAMASSCNHQELIRSQKDMVRSRHLAIRQSARSAAAGRLMFVEDNASGRSSPTLQRILSQPHSKCTYGFGKEHMMLAGMVPRSFVSTRNHQVVWLHESTPNYSHASMNIPVGMYTASSRTQACLGFVSAGDSIRRTSSYLSRSRQG